MNLYLNSDASCCCLLETKGLLISNLFSASVFVDPGAAERAAAPGGVVVTRVDLHHHQVYY